ncbi:MAG: anthranilate/aminodeoxychorismate synthase component II [Armatimonadetes bacterium 55-13]|nr:aminodeoxychorismate/anthranilate synthase component II [Armatimonadota bacterium]OJU64281.1 MAG: anthranilate/aminodeoxychorismate synthase component II [Armatimonadetes bacterium 55-13]
MILVIDNFDSFTYNLVQYLGLCDVEVVVRRNNEITLEEIERLRPAGIMLSPGPCTPDQSGVCLDILKAALNQRSLALEVPLFGVCLGHQAIGQVAGGVVKQARNIMHGKASMVSHDGKGLFEGMPNPFRAIRYHSLVVTKDSVPPGFIVTATADDDGEIMGLRHESLPIEGVQFHPESVLTEEGFTIVKNFVIRVQKSATAATS